MLESELPPGAPRAGVATTCAKRRDIAQPPPHARQHVVRMADGVLLATDVYLPSTGRGPALLARLPYDKAGEECFLPQIADWFTDRGYVVVVQDVRGKLGSAGEAIPFEAEVPDGYSTLEWMSNQSWLRGGIGMFGDSYYGFTQWAAAASGHPLLAAIAPRVTTADFTTLLSRQGVLPLEMAASWALETWVDEYLYEYEGQLDWAVRPLDRIVPNSLGGRHASGLDQWAAGHLPPQATVLASGTVPALHLGGFDDIILRGQLATWAEAASGPAAQYLHLDARDHGWTPRRAFEDTYQDPRSSAARMAEFLDDYLSPMAPFFDHYLKSTELSSAPVRWRVEDGPFSEAAAWPPPGLSPVALHLTARGGLSERPDRNATVRSWLHDPTHPVPSAVDPYYPLIDPVDESAVLRRPDVLEFTGGLLTQRCVLLGSATIDVEMTSSAPSAHLMATIYDRYPDGRARRLNDGATAVIGPWPRRCSIDLGTLGHVLEPGHSLTVALSGSSFPRYLLHPGNDTDPWTTMSFSTAQQAVRIGGTTGAVLKYNVWEDRST